MPRRLLLLLAALTTLMMVSVSSAPAAAGAQNGVRALSQPGQARTGLTGLESSCTHPGSVAGSVGIAAGFCVAAEDTSAGEGTLYHRYEPDPANQESIRDSGRLYGTRGQYGDEPAVRAYRGPAPSGDPNYIQFETNAQESNSGLPPYAFFRPGSLGVETEGDRAFICVFNVKLGGEC